MINLKLDHSHSHHLPCHPTRIIAEEPISIHETDRQQLSDNDDDDSEYVHRGFNMLKKSNDNQFQTISAKAESQFDKVEIIPIKKKKKPIQKLTPEQIYQTDVISSAFKESKKGLPTNIRELISQKQKLIEDKVYLGISEKGADLLERIYEQIDTKTHLKDQIQQNLMEMMADIQDRFQTDILDGNKYVIHKIIRSTKQDVATNKRRKLTDTKSLTFNTSMTGQNNTVRDSQSFASQDQQSQHPSQKDFSLNSSDTKKAEDFIKKIQKEQIEQRKRRKQQEERKKSFEVRSMQEKRQFEQEIKSERRNYLKRRIEAKKQIKQKQLEVRQKMNKDYKQFLKKYKSKSPLFKEKEQSFLKMQEEEKKKEQILLEKRKQEKRSINIQEIKQHEKRYKQFRQEKINEKSNQKKFISGSQTPNVKYFKGRYHQILAEQEVKEKQRQEKEDVKLIRSELIKKRDQYSRSVRQNYIPKSDEAKQKELKELMQKMQWTEKLKSGKLDPKDRNTAGNEYLRRIHELIAELRAKNKLPPISKTIDYDQFQKSTKPQYKNYLEQTRSHRRKYSVDYSKIAEVDLEDAHFRAKKLEEDAKKRQIYVGGGNFNIDRTLEERKKIEEGYLQSIKAKIALLNKFD